MKSLRMVLTLAVPLALSASLFAAGHASANPALANQSPKSTGHGSNGPASPSQPTNISYLITNDDSPGKGGATGGTFFPIASDGTLGASTRVSLGGAGVGGGYFAANRVSIYQPASGDACAFMSIAGAAEIGGVDINTLHDVGNFSGSTGESAMDNGIGLTNNGTYLYASFTTSNTIATFAILPGCALSFLGDISPLGLQNGNVKGMAMHGNLLIVTYGDGSIESFNASAGIPVSNGDLQESTGQAKDLFPVGVDITQDGHYAIFGDQSTTTDVEVSDISSGKLTTTVLYHVGPAGNSASVYLSPDETLLYISNSGSGRATAAFFNATTGVITPGCISNKLHGFDNSWTFLDSPVTQLNTGTGSVLYLAEFGNPSTIAVIDIASTGTACTLTEEATSPVQDPDSATLLTIGVYPPRSF
jgi:hypothetical protein